MNGEPETVAPPADNSLGSNQVSMVMAQDWIGGFMQGGWNQHNYDASWHTYPGSDMDIANFTTGELEGAYYDLKSFTRVQNYLTPRYPDVLLIVPAVAGQEYYYETEIYPFLALHVTVAVADESSVTSSLLNKFKATVYWFPPGSAATANRTSVQTVVDWAKSGHHVLWLGFGNNQDPYYRSGTTYSPLTPLEGYLFRVGTFSKNVTRFPTGGVDLLSFQKNFGGIAAGTKFEIQLWPGAVAAYYDSNSVPEVNGLQVLATDGTRGVFALCANGTSVFFFGPLSPPVGVKYDMPFPQSYSDPYLLLARAFLNFSGVWYDDRTDYNIQYRYDQTSGYLVAYERLGQPGTYDLRLGLHREGLNPSASYMVQQALGAHIAQDTKYLMGSNLANLPLTFSANQTVILRIQPFNGRTLQVTSNLSILQGPESSLAPFLALAIIGVSFAIIAAIMTHRRKAPTLNTVKSTQKS